MYLLTPNPFNDRKYILRYSFKEDLCSSRLKNSYYSYGGMIPCICCKSIAFEFSALFRLSYQRTSTYKNINEIISKIAYNFFIVKYT